MIEFIQDYTTKALPPEVFEDGQQVERSPESELYFVQLGVAGFVQDGQLVGQDYQPIERRVVTEVVVADRRFTTAGRGGETIGIEAPQRASTGPGNGAMFGAEVIDPVDPALHQVQVDQLSADLAASVQQLDDHRTSSAAQIEQLTGDLTLAQGAREAALTDVTRLTTERNEASGQLKAAQASVTQLEGKLATANSRIAELEQKLAASGGGTGGEQTDTAQRGRGK